jgi:putrescine aminotransferase
VSGDSPPGIANSDTAALLAACERHMGSGRASLGRLIGVVETHSAGAWVTAADGRRYLDFGGYGVFILGHRHPDVVAAVREQLDAHPIATKVFLDPVSIRAAAALASIAPAGTDCVHFANSGAEATEAALKLARLHGRRHLISARNGFHGKTLGALSVTANPIYQRPFEPLLPDLTQVPYGEIVPLRHALAAAAGQACVILEPVQGEAGVVIPPAGYLAEAARLCREHDALLIIDEIQSGLGRTGEWWASSAEVPEPDMVLVGKGLSGGVVPVAAMLARPEVYAPLGRDPFLHSSTFAGSPLACAAAAAAIRAIAQENIGPRAAALGARLLTGIRHVLAAVPALSAAEARGRGLLIGIDLGNPAQAGQLIIELLERRILVNHSLNNSQVVRLTPPAIISDAELGLFLDAFADACAALIPGPSRPSRPPRPLRPSHHSRFPRPSHFPRPPVPPIP